MAAKSLLFKEYERVPGLAHHVAARGGLYNEHAGEWSIGLSEDFEILIEGPVGGSQVQDEDLVFTLIDDFGGAGAEGGEFSAGEVAEEDGELDFPTNGGRVGRVK
jgi:hypothetical protein